MNRTDSEFPTREETVPVPDEYASSLRRAEYTSPAPEAGDPAIAGTDYRRPDPDREFTPPGVREEREPPKRKRRLLKLLMYSAAALVMLTSAVFASSGGRKPLLSSLPAETSPPVATSAPTAEPTAAPTAEPTAAPTPEPTPTPAPTPSPTPTSTPTPEPELTLDRIVGTYEVAGTGEVTGNKRWTYENGKYTRPYSGTVTITSSGENALAMSLRIEGKTITGKGSYTYAANSGSVSFTDSLGVSDTLVFTEENGRITLDITMTWSDKDVTELIVMTGTGS